ncbi:MAG: hypothetical protein HFG41_10215 [Coprococcus sp.]|nr:hypothetical protein [Coprococcus sp.]
MEMKNIKLDMHIEDEDHSFDLEMGTSDETQMSQYIRCYQGMADMYALEKEERKICADNL